MNFAALGDDWLYLLVGTFPEGPPGGALLSLILSAVSGLLSAVLGLALGIALVMGRGRALQCLRVLLGFLRAIPVLLLIFFLIGVIADRN